MLLPIAAIVAGLILLVKGADWLVEGGSSLARRLGASELAIGLTVIAFGTSLPELTVNVFSAVEDADGIAMGNAVGSSVANILLILGVAAVVTPLTVRTTTVWNEIPFSLLAAVVLLALANDGAIDGAEFSRLGRSDGLAFLAFFLIFLWHTFGLRRIEDSEVDQPTRGLAVSSLMTVLGSVTLVLGGKFAVDGAVQVASASGISQSFIGLTVVAIGTSLPELITSVVAGMKKKADIAVGNIVGSNIFNVFLVLGVGATIRPLAFDPALNVDLGLLIIATVMLFFAVHTGYINHRLRFWKQREGHKIERADGILMLATYAAYLAFLVWRH